MIASFLACSRLSAMCQLISTRQLSRLTVWPWAAAARSAKLHWVGSACRPSLEVLAILSAPMPYLPAICMPLGEMLLAVVIGMLSCSGRICSAASRRVNHSLS